MDNHYMNLSSIKPIFKCEKVARRVYSESQYNDAAEYCQQDFTNMRQSLQKNTDCNLNNSNSDAQQTTTQSLNTPKKLKSKRRKHTYSQWALPSKDIANHNTSKLEDGNKVETFSRVQIDIYEDLFDIKGESTSYETPSPHFNNESDDSSSDSSSEIEFENEDMKDEDSELQDQDQIQLRNFCDTNDHQSQIKALILQSLKDNIDAVRRLPSYKKHQEVTSNLLPQLQHSNSNKCTLILDLDETLVHCSFRPFKGFQEVVQVTHAVDFIQLYISYRPYLQEFLDYVSQEFEVVVFTASEQQYADLVLDRIDPHNKYFTHRLYRQQCIVIQDSFIKDLNLLGRDLSKTIIVDNSLLAFAYHLSNGIPIPSYFGQYWDEELSILSGILQNLVANSSQEDVRVQIQNMFQVQEKIFSSTN